MLDKIMHSEPEPLARAGVSVPPALESAIFRCLAKQRSQRFPSAQELREALEAVLPILPTGAAGLTLERSSGLIPVPPGNKQDTPKANVTYEPPPQGYQGATLQLPPSEAPPALDDDGDMPTLPPPNAIDTDEDFRPKRRGGWIALLLVAAAVVVGFFVLRSRGVAPFPVAAQATVTPPAVESAEPKPAESAAEHPAVPAVATAEVPATALGIDPFRLPPAASAARKAGAARPSAPRPASEAPKPKSVTKVDNAGF